MEKVKYNKSRNYYLPFLIPYLLILLIFIVLPMVFIFVYSILDLKTDLPIYVVTLENYQSFFETILYIKCIWKSIYLAFLATLVCLIVCYPISYFIAKRKPATQALLILLVTAPMWVNMLLRTLAIKQVLDGPLLKLVQMVDPDVNILIGNDFSVIFGMVYNYIPYMILPIYTILSKIDARLIEASIDLGARNRDTFLNVIAPLSLPGVMSGVTIVFLSSATTITITKYLGEGRYFLIGNLIETEFITNSRWSFGSAISVILLLLIMAIMWLMNRVSRKEVLE